MIKIITLGDIFKNIETEEKAFKFLNYIKKLQSNWNSLKDWVFEHIDSIEFNSYDDVLDKMNELEGLDNESN